jgi:hypothetical protein
MLQVGKSAALYAAAEANEPDSVPTLHARAVHHRRRGQLEEAERCLLRVQALEPGNGWAPCVPCNALCAKAGAGWLSGGRLPLPARVAPRCVRACRLLPCPAAGVTGSWQQLQPGAWGGAPVLCL